MRNLVFLLVLFLALPACKGGDNTAKNNMKKKEVELILQTRKSADISAVCLAHNDVGLKSKKVLSARMGTWLVSVMSSRSEEHTSELQSRRNLVCRLLLGKKKNKTTIH